MKKKDLEGGVVLCGILAGILWALLIAAQATGAVSMGWTVVLLGCVWIPASMIMVVVLEGLAIILTARIMCKVRLRKVNRRVRAEAKTLGVWGKPQCMGGRALSLYAWECLRIKRRPGESDLELRHRCIRKMTEKSGEGKTWV